MIDGRFELVARLGGGGMGLVWQARDLMLRRDVALKEVRPPDPGLAEYDPAAARALRDRVLREARALARVTHPNVVTIHHIVDEGEESYPWLVMELVTGGSLQDRLDRGRLTPGEAATLGREILKGLCAAHAAGIQHRDIKPANVLLRPDGSPVVTDFGIAALHGSTALTAAGSLIGTPDFMAPERAGGEEGGPAADLWSLALTLYVAVEGQNPLRRSGTLATLAAVLSEDVPPAREAGPLTAALTAVLVRDPAARPDSETLDGLLAEAESAEGAVTEPEPEPAEASDARPEDPDTATSYRIAPPAPTRAPRRVRKSWFAAVGAVALTGVLTWTLWPDGGDGKAEGGDKPSASTSSSTPRAPTTATTPTVTIGIKSDQPGFARLKDDGTYTGLDVEVATYIARALGHDPAAVEWKVVTSAERESALTRGEVDLVVATYAITDRRAQQVDFAGPYLTAHQDVLLRADETGVTQTEDLEGKTLCSVTGSTSAENITKHLTWSAVYGRSTYEVCMQDLATGNVDAVTTDNALLAGYAAQAKYQGKFKLAGFKLTDERYGVGLPKGSPLRGRIDTALKAMVADGSWAAAVEKNLPLLGTTGTGKSPTG
ncbi:bifunctional serine/threonine-protein kinase/glutamate ABC transporter substrate-binding protein [Streptomyces sp. NPDC058579]|uniref:bifunctional serine/threonine-protein kinase/glutamate ABC transporter substrate-binding protein n=1 Tax=Streptomyces sp. NPDC058579 TaxID=3346548 RepID=UPI00364B8303